MTTKHRPSPPPQRRSPTRSTVRPTRSARQRPTTSVLTATTLVYAYRAGITAAAGTRLALCWLLDKMFTVFSFQLENPLGPLLLFLVTTSRCPDWVICAPAAFLGCGSRFSGSLSGVPHPRSVTRQNHGKTIPYHPKLIGQKFERCVAQKMCNQKNKCESPNIGLYLQLVPRGKTSPYGTYLALELLRLSE
jgi:hypothetical protein